MSILEVSAMFTVGTAIVSLIDKIINKKGIRDYYIAIFTFFIAIGSIWMTYTLGKESKKSETIKEKALENEQKKNDLAMQKIVELNIQLKNKAEDLRKKAEHETVLTGELLKYSSGDSSFCYIGFSHVEDSLCNVSIINPGKYPIYEATLRIVSLDNFNKYDKDEMNMSQAFFKLSVGNIPPDRGLYLGSYTIPKASLEYKVNIFISTRNSYLIQQTIFRKRGNTKIAAFRILNSGKEVYRYVPKGFLKDGEKTVPFDKYAFGELQLNGHDKRKYHAI